MASYNLGQVAIVDKGAYSSSANYDVLNQVSAHGGSFICVQNCSNIEPTVTTGWQNYWHPTAVGIKNVSVAANSSNKVVVTINLSDGTQYVSSPLEITAIATGAVGTTQLATNAVETEKVKDGAITENKLGSQAVNLTSKVKDKLPIKNGGTNANTAADARTNLGVTEKGKIEIGGTVYTIRKGAYSSGAAGYLTLSTS